MSTKRKTQSSQRTINKLRTMSGGSQAESERDSGFSDASSEPTSTRGTTDSEDLTHCAPQQGVTCGSGSLISQLAVVGGSSYPNMSPMIIMNNVLLQQPGDAPKPLKPWGFRPALEVVQPVVPPPQVVFIQPVISHPTPPPSHKDPHSSRHRRPKKYLPLLKSYPKIAPHPGDGISSGGSSTASSSSSSSASSMTSSSSSSSSRSKRCAKATSGHREHSHRGKRHHQKKKSHFGGRSSPSGTTAIPPASPGALSPKPLPSTERGGGGGGSDAGERLTPTAASVPSNSEPREPPPVATTTTPLQTQTSPVAMTTTPPLPQTQTVTGCYQEPADPDPETKRMRFCNTYNILSSSGLLDITLKTKELLRENDRTQGELDRLKAHTELFVQALLSGEPGVFLKLQTRLREEEEERGGDTGEGDTAKGD